MANSVTVTADILNKTTIVANVVASTNITGVVSNGTILTTANVTTGGIGPQGPTGLQGPPGAQGIQGIQGIGFANQLTANLDVNGFSIISVSNGNIPLTPNGTGQVIVTDPQLREPAYTITSATGVYTLDSNFDVANGTVQLLNLGSATSFTWNGFASPVAGQSATLILTNNGVVTVVNSTMKFSGGVKTLSGVVNAIDLIIVYYDGTNYYANISRGYS